MSFDTLHPNERRSRKPLWRQLGGFVSPLSRFILDRYSLTFLSGLFVFRIVVQVLLYRAGFLAFTADEFSRAVLAGRFALDPEPVWHGSWLPFHTYLMGTALRVHWDLLWTPRIITAFFGLVSLVLVYQLTFQLFSNRGAAAAATALMTLNPLHIWLSATPLTEILHTAFLLGFLLGLVKFLQKTSVTALFSASILLGLANGIRYESWVTTLVFSSLLVVFHGWDSHRGKRQEAKTTLILLAAVLPWVFPVLWVVGSYLATGHPFEFVRAISEYKLFWYGEGKYYAQYPRSFLAIDSSGTILAVLALIFGLRKIVRQREFFGYAALVGAPLLVFLSLHAGQIEPPANQLRYMGPFLFLAYPAVGGVLEAGTRRFAGIFPRGNIHAIQGLLFTLIFGVIAIGQVQNVFQFQNDPYSGGLPVGQRLAGLHSSYPGGRVLIERRYWQYLSATVGYGELEPVLYDRPLTQDRQAPSQMQKSAEELRSFLEEEGVRFVAVWSPDLAQNVSDAGYLFVEEVTGAAIFMAPGE